jgi:phospholipid/cholesterol/gamma-HCH transport system substrate-binding protein
MKISIEVKVGIIGIATIVVLIWGINYLKGRNILSSTYEIYTHFSESGGLESSAPVLLNGVKIGYVDQIILHTDQVPPIRLALHIEKEYPIPEGSRAELFSADLLGTKAIRIIPSSQGVRNMADQDTIMGTISPDLIASLQNSLFPILDQVSRLAGTLDTLSRKLSDIAGSDALGDLLEHLAATSGSLKAALGPGGSLDQSFSNLESFTGVLQSQEEEVASMIRNLNSISEAVDSAGLDQLGDELYQASHQFNTLLEQVNSGNGNAGKLFYSDSLYVNLELLIADLDQLVRDLNDHPEDYVQISVFGKSKKKK